MYAIIDTVQFAQVDRPDYDTLESCQQACTELEIEYGLEAGRLQAIEIA